MTVITYRDGVMAGDCCWCDNTQIISSRTKVIRLSSGVLYGSAGDVDDRALMAALNDVHDPTGIPCTNELRSYEADIRALLVFPSGEVFWIDTGKEDCGVIPIDAPFVAVGCGGKVATGAMAMGADAARAAEIACEHDVFCRPPITSLKLNNAMLDRRPWAQTNSGHAFPLINPSPSDVVWSDIVFSLAHNNRYAGNAGVYSVAQHSILVADLLPREWRLWGLLHDAHEFAIGDITRPVQLAIGNQAKQAIKNLKVDIDRAVFAAAGLPWPMPANIEHAVKDADMRVMWTEKRDLLTPVSNRTHDQWAHGIDPLPPLDFKIEPWSAQQSILEFALALTVEGIKV